MAQETDFNQHCQKMSVGIEFSEHMSSSRFIVPKLFVYKSSDNISYCEHLFSKNNYK